MYAIIKTGGKQYKVAKGDTLKIEKLDLEANAKFELDPICVVDGDKLITDAKEIANFKVNAVILEQFKDKKQLVFKHKKRKNYKTLRGHRQNLSLIQIESIAEAKAAKKAADKKAESQEVKEAESTKKVAEKPAKTASAKTASAKAPSAKATAPKEAKPKAATAKATKPKTTKDAAKKAAE